MPLTPACFSRRVSSAASSSVASESSFGRQRGDRVALGKLLDDRKGALPDRAGGTENGEFFQSAFNFLLHPLSLVAPAG
jgi:hypothetical protein